MFDLGFDTAGLTETLVLMKPVFTDMKEWPKTSVHVVDSHANLLRYCRSHDVTVFSRGYYFSCFVLFFYTNICLKLSLQASLFLSTLVMAEHISNKLIPVTLNYITAASEVGGEVLHHA